MGERGRKGGKERRGGKKWVEESKIENAEQYEERYEFLGIHDRFKEVLYIHTLFPVGYLSLT